MAMEEYTVQETNTRFDLLGRYERRCVIRFLQETEHGYAELDDVAIHLTKQAPTTSDPEQIKTALLHNHIPKMASSGVVEFDFRSETVLYRGDDLVDALLEVTPEPHVPRP